MIRNAFPKKLRELVGFRDRWVLRRRGRLRDIDARYIHRAFLRIWESTVQCSKAANTATAGKYHRDHSVRRVSFNLVKLDKTSRQGRSGYSPSGIE